MALNQRWLGHHGFGHHGFGLYAFGQRGFGQRGLGRRLLGMLSGRFRRHIADCVDLRAETDDPVHAAYLSPEAPFLISVAASHCRGLHSVAHSLCPAGNHPFTLTVRAIAAGLADYHASPLFDYYRSFTPMTAADALGIPLSEAHPDFHSPPLAATLPWDFRSPAESLDFWTTVCGRDYRHHGFSLTHQDGWKAWGPMSETAGRAEFQRLQRAYASIASLGYRRHGASDGDIEAAILRHGTQTRFVLGKGQHRAAVLAALGHDRLPLRLTSAIVNRDDAPLWPNVRRGIYTVPLALRVFDRVFSGCQPSDMAVNRLRTVQ